MLMKSADDKNSYLQLLKDRENQPLSKRQRQWLSEQLDRVQKGIRGETDSAYYINAAYRDSENYVVLHDLCFQIDGETVQIDHLILGHYFCFLLETKNFNGDLYINEYGEFTVQYGHKKVAIPSPIEQSKRHQPLLLKLLEQLDIKAITGKSLEVRHVVLVSPKFSIHRPNKKDFDTSFVIKADALRQWREQFTKQEVTFGLAAKATLNILITKPGNLINMPDTKTLKAYAQRLIGCHQPATLGLPGFMQPSSAQQAEIRPICIKCGQTVNESELKLCTAYAARFGGKIYCLAHQQEALSQSNSPKAVTETGPVKETAQPVARCTHPDCGVEVSDDVVRYCQRYTKRFNGNIYCRVHQKTAAKHKVRQKNRPEPMCEYPSCNKTLSAAVVRFCKTHNRRFQNKLYCMEHQQLIQP